MTMQTAAGGRTKVIRWVGLLVLSALFAAALEFLRLPAALLLGPMLAAILFAAAERAVPIPNLLTSIGQGVIGCMIAKSIPLSILAEVAKNWPIFIASVVSVIAAAVALGLLLAKLDVVPGTTAIWGSMPGGSSAMVIMSESFGADLRLVAFMQYLRIVCVAVAASAISRFWIGETAAPAAATIWFPPINPVAMAETFALIIASMAVTRLLRIPSGIFILPMIVGMILVDTDVISIELPPWLLAVCYAFLGWAIGARFSRGILRHVARALPKVLLSTTALIAICGAFAVVLVYVAGVDPLTAYLATSPGGADSVAIIAASSNVDVPFIMAMQLARLLMILFTGPALARWVVAWSGLSDELPESGERLSQACSVDAK